MSDAPVDFTSWRMSTISTSGIANPRSRCSASMPPGEKPIRSGSVTRLNARPVRRVVGLDRWCRAPQQERAVSRLNDLVSQTYRLILGRGILLVRAVLLFVDDDRAQLWQGSEERRAGTDHDWPVAARNRGPGRIAIDIPKLGMDHRHFARKPLLETAHDLSRQRNFRNEHNRAGFISQAPGRRSQIKLRFATPGHTMNQYRTRAPTRQLPLDRIPGPGLRFRQQRRPGRRYFFFEDRNRQIENLQGALPFERPQSREIDPVILDEVPDSERCLLRDHEPDEVAGAADRGRAVAYRNGQQALGRSYGPVRIARFVRTESGRPAG